MTDEDKKILDRARHWDATRKARASAGPATSKREKAQLDKAHWQAGNDLSEAIEKAREPP